MVCVTQTRHGDAPTVNQKENSHLVTHLEGVTGKLGEKKKKTKMPEVRPVKGFVQVFYSRLKITRRDRSGDRLDKEKIHSDVVMMFRLVMPTVCKVC